MILGVAAMVSIGACHDRSTDEDTRRSAGKKDRRVRIKPPPAPPQPGDPYYPEYVASRPLQDASRHLKTAILELLRGRARLMRLNREQHRAKIAECDKQLRELLTMLCADHIAIFGVNVEHTAIDELFPIEQVEAARSFECGGLWVGRR